MGLPPKMPRGPRRDLRAQLRERLNGAAKVALLAVGSEERSDDAAGILVARRLAGLSWPSPLRLRIFLGATAPENLTGQIKKFKPTHLVAVDAADLGKAPGAISVLDMEGAVGGPSFCTHNLPLTIMLRYLANSLACEIIILGIQPRSLEFNRPPSAAVDRAAGRLASAIRSVLAG